MHAPCLDMHVRCKADACIVKTLYVSGHVSVLNTNIHDLLGIRTLVTASKHLLQLISKGNHFYD